MKLLHHAGVVKQDRHEHPKRSPFSSFKLPVGSLALLSAFAFAPMTFHRPAAAQDWTNQDWPVTLDTTDGVLGDVARHYHETLKQYYEAHPAERRAAPRMASPDSAKPAAVPAADTAKPAAAAASDSALLPAAAHDAAPTGARRASATTKSAAPSVFYWQVFFEAGLRGLEGSSIFSIDNVPLAIRDVPVNPEDLKLYYMDSSWSKPINPKYQADNFEAGMDWGFAVGAFLIHRSLRAELGIGANWGYNPLSKNERNYVNHDYSGGGSNYVTTGDSLSYDRSNGNRSIGMALTWYDIDYKDAMLPYAFAEIGIPRLHFALGYRVYLERFIAENGWDRYDSRTDRLAYTTYKTYDFTTLISGMPYISIPGGKAYDPEDAVINASAYAGVKFVMLNMPSAMAKGVHFVFHPALAIGVHVGAGMPIGSPQN